MLCQFGKHLYVMVRRLPSSLIGECLGCFRHLCMMYLFVNVFVHQQMEDFIHKNSKIGIYRFIQQSLDHHKHLWQVGNLANII